MKSVLFFIVSLIHVLIWGFVLIAFTNPTLAKINVLYVIPFIYVIHTILPFHILESAKKNMYPTTHSQKFDEFKKQTVIPHYFDKLNAHLEWCTFNPLSPQGMLVFGLITSIYSIKISNTKL